jgi:hypothetical protein
MRVSTAAVVLIALLPSPISAFSPVQFSSSRVKTTKLAANSNNLHEFDYLLGENSIPQLQPAAQQQQQLLSRRKIYLHDERKTVLTSSTFSQPGVDEQTLKEYMEQAQQNTGGDSYDPYADVGLEETAAQMQKIQLHDDSLSSSMSAKVESKLKTMDLQDIIGTLILPSIVAFAGGRWVYNRVSSKVGGAVEASLDSFATEMIYHDGDFDEMKMCVSDYGKKLVWLGPQKSRTMLKRYLELYAKKRTVSPRSIRYVSTFIMMLLLNLMMMMCVKGRDCPAQGLTRNVWFSSLQFPVLCL